MKWFNPIHAVIISIVIFVLFVISFNLISNYIYGNYRVNRYWISSDYNGNKICDNCLWIEFEEGCNKYKTFYFENQHEIDKRLEVGMPVNIYFSNFETIKNIEPRIKYRECSI